MFCVMKYEQILELSEKLIMKIWLKYAKTFDGGVEKDEEVIKSSCFIIVHYVLPVCGCLPLILRSCLTSAIQRMKSVEYEKTWRENVLWLRVG